MKVYYPDLQTECASIGEAMKMAKPGDIIYIVYDTSAIEEYEMPYAKLEQINMIEQLQKEDGIYEEDTTR
jgi:hypothetical protein